MTDPLAPPRDQDDLLAAEYVLGVLDLAQRTAAQTRLRDDPAFAARVADWETRLDGLNDAYDEVPAPNLLPRIEARLFPIPTRQNRLRILGAWGTAAASALVVVAYLALTPATPSLVATLSADNAALRFQAVLTDGRLTLTRTAGTAADPRFSHELWLIVGDTPPVSLGLIDAAQEIISLPGIAPGAVLAVSQEQPGGSPDGQPKGPILVLGVLNAA